ncbi:MAG TPA: zf-HC2 domain-containing protein [Gemmatimonadaceae bacterium]|jgi:hypothetical protein
MNDCTNAEMRDLLPELANGRLDGASLMSIRGHLEGCADCTEEFALLQRSRAVLILATPRVDVDRISSAIVARPPVAARSSFNWRIAASILFVAAAGAGGALMYAGHGPERLRDSLAIGVPSARTAESQTADLALGGDLSGLTDDDLRALLGKVQEIEALPAAEVRAPAVSPVVSGGGTGTPDSSGAM